MEVKTYTKRDIAIKVGEKLNISIRKSISYTDEVFKAVREILCEDKNYIRIEIRNFGVLESKPAKAKPKARNPKTNEEIFVPAHKKAHFKPGKILKTHLKKPI
jgi:integration host factor subunit beta|tara:strand:- start:134 stop:442 length:309 start_codon:yes stop_codon:yes gene_type:complete